MCPDCVWVAMCGRCMGILHVSNLAAHTKRSLQGSTDLSVRDCMPALVWHLACQSRLVAHNSKSLLCARCLAPLAFSSWPSCCADKCKTENGQIGLVNLGLQCIAVLNNDNVGEHCFLSGITMTAVVLSQMPTCVAATQVLCV